MNVQGNRLALEQLLKKDHCNKILVPDEDDTYLGLKSEGGIFWEDSLHCLSKGFLCLMNNLLCNCLVCTIA